MIRVAVCFVLTCLGGLASAQRYDWTIENTELVYGKDTASPQTSRSSLAHISMTIEDVSDGVIRVTFHSIDIRIPDTPIGDMGFDSDEPVDPANVLEGVLRPLVGLTYTLTYDLHDRVLKPSDELVKERGTSAFGQTISPPFLTVPFAPFMLFQGDASPEQPRSFMLLPYSNGVQIGDATLIDYVTDGAGDSVRAEAEIDVSGEGDMPGISSPAKIRVTGHTRSKHNPKSFELIEHDYEITTTLGFEYGPGMPVRSELVTKVRIRRAESDPGQSVPSDDA
ncbi:MAG: hypothetical protein ACF8MF_05835 [Phycisphaerales bacterium JB052]